MVRTDSPGKTDALRLPCERVAGMSCRHLLPETLLADGSSCSLVSAPLAAVRFADLNSAKMRQITWGPGGRKL